MAAPSLECFTTDALPEWLPFCLAVRVGDLVFLSGNIGNVTSEVTLVEGDVMAETRQALEHMRKALEAAGSSVDRVIKCTVFLTDIAEFQAMNEAYTEFFGAHRPARSTVAVKDLAVGADVEIERIALAG